MLARLPLALIRTLEIELQSHQSCGTGCWEVSDGGAVVRTGAVSAAGL